MDNFSSFYSSLSAASTSNSSTTPDTAMPASDSAPPSTSAPPVQIALSPPSSDSEPSSPHSASSSSPPPNPTPPSSSSSSSSLSPMSAAIAASSFAKPLAPASATPMRAPSSTRTSTRNPSLPPRTQDRSMLSPIFPTLSSAQRVSSATSAPGSGRNKVALDPGHSPLDWAQYKNSGKDLRGLPAGRVRLTLDEVAKHKSVDDCWTVLNGKVYNMTPYVTYHPGGVKQLMKGAGKDATKLFLAVHAWVNADYLLDACFLGPLES